MLQRQFIRFHNPYLLSIRGFLSDLFDFGFDCVLLYFL